ncbi:hypothetical protein KCU81_g6275, partial [Aureobasidium melanogenum]|uniref:BTB domain-containing protein n=1 Tax=Aureobasidium melanogenum (strain CBS 110374) TaxID=1043003 RepID=A0A074VFM1_AURM1
MTSEHKANTTFGSSFGLFNDPTHKDVTLVFGDTDHPTHRRVHKILFAAKSKYFSKLFKEMNDDICKLEVGDCNSVEAMIRHVYGLAFNKILDESGNPMEHGCTDFFLDVYQVADHYQLEDLRDEVASKLGSQIGSLYWGCQAKLWRFADKFDKYPEHEAIYEGEPVHGWFAFIINHFKQLREQQDFRDTVLGRAYFLMTFFLETHGISKFDKTRGAFVCSSCVKNNLDKDHKKCVVCKEKENTSE